ncbi:hypothetical protein GCM10010464_67680 [Pseudonocardia yunnanensis]|uniref:DUF6069 family protein n=1 Tax=Pseudonocardia yunnanensis TaxID=58107 RepID=A0ABW4F2Q0_9PSEU
MTTTTRPPSRTAARRATAVVLAVLAPLAIWAVAVPVAGLDLTATPIGGTATPVGALAVVAGALCAGLSGWALLAVLERRAARPRRAWTVIALVVLALSLATPLMGATGTEMLILLSMHLAVGAVLIALL